VISTLELVWTERVLTGAQTPRRFLDFVVDGEPLYPLMGDFISPLGWLGEEENKLAVYRLLRKAEPDAPYGRTCIYVCSECADLGCGALSVVIDRVGDNIVWRDFGFQNNYDDMIRRDGWEDLGPLSFNATDYYDAIKKAMEKPE
jgi:hypothetical protein